MIWIKNIKLSKSAKKDKLSLILRSNYKRSVQFTNCPTWNKIFSLNGLELSHLRILIHQNHQISFHHSTLLFIDERLFVQYFLSFAWYFQKEDYLIFEFIDDLSSMMSFTLQEIKTLYQRTFAVPSYIIQISWHTWINKVIKSASILKFSLNNCNISFDLSVINENWEKMETLKTVIFHIFN